PESIIVVGPDASGRYLAIVLTPTFTEGEWTIATATWMERRRAERLYREGNGMREELKGFTPEELERAAEEARALRTEAWDRRLQDDSDDLSDLHPVRVKTSKRQNARATVGLRLGAGELDLIERAAKARGITFSEFVRDAALMVAYGKISDEE